jgi:hypothetical protein
MKILAFVLIAVVLLSGCSQKIETLDTITINNTSDSNISNIAVIQQVDNSTYPETDSDANTSNVYTGSNSGFTINSSPAPVSPPPSPVPENVSQPSYLCSDETAYGSCSESKPLFCANGTLTDNCSYCGCDLGECIDNLCVELNYIRPVIFLGSDTNITPSYVSTVDSSFAAVQTWYSNQLSGKTFRLKPSIVYVSNRTQRSFTRHMGQA